MNLFKKTVLLQSSKSMEEVIALIDSCIEPYHKDGSVLMFEGRISSEGDFDFNVAPSGTAYRSYSGIVSIKGNVKECEKGGSVTEVVFIISKISRVIMYFAIIVMVLFTVLLFTDIITQFKGPYYLPLIFLIFLMINFKITFQNQVNKALNNLKAIIA